MLIERHVIFFERSDSTRELMAFANSVTLSERPAPSTSTSSTVSLIAALEEWMAANASL